MPLNSRAIIADGYLWVRRSLVDANNYSGRDVFCQSLRGEGKMILNDHLRSIRFNANEYISPCMIDTWTQEVTVLRAENRKLKLEIGYLMDQIEALRKTVKEIDE